MNQTDSWARRSQGKHLITAARFLGHRGIQERDIMANVLRNAIIVILRCRWQARNGCVMPFTWNCKGHLIHRSFLVLFSIIWPIRNILNVLPHDWCSQNSGDVNKNLSILTRCFPPVNVWPSRWYQWSRWLTFLHGEEEGAWVSSLLEQSGQARQKLEERWNYDKFC